MDWGTIATIGGTLVALGALILTVVITISKAAWNVRSEISASSSRVHGKLEEELGKVHGRMDDLSDTMRCEAQQNREEIRDLGSRVTVVERTINSHIERHIKD